MARQVGLGGQRAGEGERRGPARSEIKRGRCWSGLLLRGNGPGGDPGGRSGCGKGSWAGQVLAQREGERFYSFICFVNSF